MEGKKKTVKIGNILSNPVAAPFSIRVTSCQYKNQHYVSFREYSDNRYFWKLIYNSTTHNAPVSRANIGGPSTELHCIFATGSKVRYGLNAGVQMVYLYMSVSRKGSRQTDQFKFNSNGSTGCNNFLSSWLPGRASLAIKLLAQTCPYPFVGKFDLVIFLSWVMALFWPLLAFWLFSLLTCLCILACFVKIKIWYEIRKQYV